MPGVAAPGVGRNWNRSLVLKSAAPQNRHPKWPCFGLATGAVPSLLAILTTLGAVPVQGEPGSMATGPAVTAPLTGTQNEPDPGRPLARVDGLPTKGDGEGERVTLDIHAEVLTPSPAASSHAQPSLTPPRRHPGIHPGFVNHRVGVPGPDWPGTVPLTMPAINQKFRFGTVRPDRPDVVRPEGPDSGNTPIRPALATLYRPPDDSTGSAGAWGRLPPDDVFVAPGTALDPAAMPDGNGSSVNRSVTGTTPESPPGVPVADGETIERMADEVLDIQAAALPQLPGAADPGRVSGRMDPGSDRNPALSGPETPEPARPLFVIPDTHVASGRPLVRPEGLTAIAKQGGVPLTTYIQRPDVLSFSSRSPSAGRINRTVRNHATQEDVWEVGNPQLLAIFKRNRSYSALILMPDGSTEHVRRGSSFSGGKVTSITSHEAIYRIDGQTYTLRIQ